MKKLLEKENFPLLAGIGSAILSFPGGILLAFVPYVSGGIYHTSTGFSFRPATALGYWLFGAVLSFAVYLLALLLQKTLEGRSGGTD